MEKTAAGSQHFFKAPQLGKELEVALIAKHNNDTRFVLTIAEGARSSVMSIKICGERKTKFQLRQVSQVLIRVDLDPHGKHRNPDGEIIEGHHIHIGSMQHGDKIAYPLYNQDCLIAKQTDSIPDLYEKFADLCRIDNNLTIEWSLGL